ncbi:MAG: hypothetical protein AAF493_20370, partial [Pseudomonadota bacterium]
MDDYERGLAQFRAMVGDDRIDGLIKRFGAVSPDFRREVVSVVGHHSHVPPLPAGPTPPTPQTYLP